MTKKDPPTSDGRFKKGFDIRRGRGGPGPEVAQVKKYARKNSIEAIRAIMSLVRHSKLDRVRLAAAEAILDRAIGKPTQMIGGDPDAPLQLGVDRSLLETFERLAAEADAVKELDVADAELVEEHDQTDTENDDTDTEKGGKE